METTIIKQRIFHLSDRTRELIVLGICLACMFLFLSAAYSKVVEHEKFIRGLSKVTIIGPYAKLIAFIVPIIEIVVSILLIIPKTYRWGLYGFSGTMIVFTFYILGMWLWAKNLPCQCNLLIEKLSWGEHVWFNIAFIGVAILALKLSKSNIKLQILKKNEKFSKISLRPSGRCYGNRI